MTCFVVYMLPCFFRCCRTIYPGEFDNLVERMRVRSKNSMRGFRFDVEVVDAMLGVALDTELGVDVSREGCVRVKFPSVVD